MKQSSISQSFHNDIRNSAVLRGGAVMMMTFIELTDSIVSSLRRDRLRYRCVRLSPFDMSTIPNSLTLGIYNDVFRTIGVKRQRAKPHRYRLFMHTAVLVHIRGVIVGRA